MNLGFPAGPIIADEYLRTIGAIELFGEIKVNVSPR